MRGLNCGPLTLILSCSFQSVKSLMPAISRYPVPEIEDLPGDIRSRMMLGRLPKELK